MYTMKEVCNMVNLPYETLKYYSNMGLIPNIQRNENNYRLFNDQNIEWIKGLICIKKCGMSINEMKHFLDLCIEGDSSIPARKLILEQTRQELLKKQLEIKESLSYINDKQLYYDNILNETIKFESIVLLNKKK